jgi:hypothetical protein
MKTIIRRLRKLEERIPLEVETGAKERLLALLGAMNRRHAAGGPVDVEQITELLRTRFEAMNGAKTMQGA